MFELFTQRIIEVFVCTAGAPDEPERCAPRPLRRLTAQQLARRVPMRT
jgi:hypothetical protein